MENRLELVKAMKQRLEAHACWFNFYEDGACSPYKAILHSLEARSRQLPRYLHPAHWTP